MYCGKITKNIEIKLCLNVKAKQLYYTVHDMKEDMFQTYEIG